MARWYYKKYRKDYSDWSNESKRITSNYSSNWSPFLDDVYWSEPQWNSSLGQYVPVGTPSNRSEGWDVNNRELLASKIFSYDMFQEDNGSYGWWSDVYTRTRTELESVLIGEVVAEEGTYPDKGWHTDGYYYIKDRLAFPALRLKTGGTWKTADMGWVKINNVWREVDEVYANISGVWKKSE